GGGRLVGYDQHADFASATAQWVAEHGMDADLRHAPLGEAPKGWPGQWYQLTDVPERIDLLIIDGPPWTVHPNVRGAAEVLFDRIPVGGRVLLDDAARPGERVVASRWRKNWPGFSFRYDGRGSKGTLIGIRSIAMSLTLGFDKQGLQHWKTPITYGPGIIERLMAHDWPAGVLMNVNYPRS
ncbi:MAG: hypothetical protein HC767_14200, partial [Akkermansiaceae bacterium]|nr:hypothetical protein [Akkermansiaceae bacterium]